MPVTFPVTYKDSGVDIDAGNKAVTLMKGYVRTTFNKSVLGDLGSFGGLIEFLHDVEKTAPGP